MVTKNLAERHAAELQRLADKLDVIIGQLNQLAESIEAGVLKKTTQRSPEWWGGANC